MMYLPIIINPTANINLLRNFSFKIRIDKIMSLLNLKTTLFNIFRNILLLKIEGCPYTRVKRFNPTITSSINHFNNFFSATMNRKDIKRIIKNV